MSRNLVPRQNQNWQMRISITGACDGLGSWSLNDSSRGKLMEDNHNVPYMGRRARQKERRIPVGGKLALFPELGLITFS
eukprot:755441-Hanusia_phi.AAC.4